MPMAHLILRTLELIPELHGYAIRQLTEPGAWSFPMSNPIVYPTLRDLEEQGFVTSRTEVVQGRERRFYAITPEGRAEVSRWLQDPESMDMGKGAWRDPMMFKIRMLREGALEGSREWLRPAIDYWQRYVEELKSVRVLELAAEHGSQIPKYTGLAAEFGAELAQLRIRFYERVLEEIEHDLAEGSDR